MQPDTRGSDPLQDAGPSPGFRSVTPAGHRQRSDDRPRRALPLLSGRAGAAHTGSSRYGTTSRPGMIHVFASISRTPSRTTSADSSSPDSESPMLAAFIIAQIIAQTRCRRRGHDPAPISDLIFAAVSAASSAARSTTRFSWTTSRRCSVARALYSGEDLIGGIISRALRCVAQEAQPASCRRCRRDCRCSRLLRWPHWMLGRRRRLWKTVEGPWAVSFPNGAPPSTVENMSHLFHMQLPAGLNPMLR